MDECIHVTDTAPVLIIIRGVYPNGTVHEELYDLCSFKDTCTEDNLFLNVKESILF